MRGLNDDMLFRPPPRRRLAPPTKMAKRQTHAMDADGEAPSSPEVRLGGAYFSLGPSETVELVSVAVGSRVLYSLDGAKKSYSPS